MSPSQTRNLSLDHISMEEASHFLDLPSPPDSYHFIYSDNDQYLDASRSETQSSATSPYDMTFPGDFAGSNTMPSPDEEGEDGSESPEEPSASTTQTQPKPATKRKRENRYKNAPPSVLSRRRAQNRASQRAYRERKDQRIKDLEQLLNDAKARNDALNQAYAELHAECVKLKASQLNSHHIASSYSTAGPVTDVGGFVGPAMAALNTGSGLDVYLYPEVATYSI